MRFDAARSSWQMRLPAKILLVLFGVSLAFDNFPPTFQIAGLFTGSPALLGIAIGFLILPRDRGGMSASIRWWTLGVLGFGLLSCAIWIFSHSGTVDVTRVMIGTDTLLMKGVKTLVIVASWGVAIVVGFRLLRWNPRALLYVGSGLLSISIVILLLQTTGLSSSAAVDWAHAVAWHEGRPRGFKFESSVFGASIVAAVALLLMAVRKRWQIAVLLTTVLLLATWSSSRGAVVSVLGGSVIAAAVWAVRRFGSRLALLLVAIALVGVTIATSVFGFYLATNDAWGDWVSAGSDATRSGWGLVVASAVVQPPLGLNLMNYWVDVQPLVAQAHAELATRYELIDLREFRGLATSQSDSGLSPKALPAVLAVWFGLPGLIAATVLLVSAVIVSSRVVTRAAPYVGRSTGPLFGASMVATALMTFVPGIFTYETALVIGGALAIGSIRKPTTYESAFHS